MPTDHTRARAAQAREGKDTKHTGATFVSRLTLAALLGRERGRGVSEWLNEMKKMDTKGKQMKEWGVKKERKRKAMDSG